MEEDKKVDVQQIKEEVKKEIKEEEKKKKSNGCLIALFVVLFFFIMVAGGIYWGYRKVVKAFEPKDLGVTYSQQDYDSLMETLGLEADPTLLCIDCPTPTYSEPHEVVVSVSNAQASAAFEYINQHLSNASISGTQIKMGDGVAELTTTLEFQGKTFPIYMVGSIEKASETSISGNIQTLKAGGLSFPSNISSMVQEGLTQIANEKLASAGDTVRIDNIAITENGFNFNGLIPGKVQ